MNLAGAGTQYSQGDTPENLLDGTGESLGRVGRLGSGKADKLGTGEGEGGGDEDGAEAAEAVLEGTGVLPELATLVLVELAAGGAAAADEDDGDNHEDDGSGELEARAPELLLGEAQGAEDVDEDDEDPEEGDPHGLVDVLVPVLHGEGDDGEFER